jgi:hypothetical protein
MACNLLGQLCCTIRDINCMCCDCATIPYDRSKVTAATVQQCLRNGKFPNIVIESIEVEHFGAGAGLLSELCRIVPKYGAGSKGPATIICKTTPKVFTVRLIARLFNLFRSEVRWMEDGVSVKVGVPGPDTYFLHYDETHARFCIMMEDLAPICVPPPSQVTGASIGQATIIVTKLAKLHAVHEDKVRATAGKWVNLWDEHFPLFDIAGAEIKKNTNAMMKAMASRYGIDWAKFPQSQTTALVMKDHILRFTKYLTPVESGGPLHTTLMHGDPRIENFFFQPFRMIDYQLCREAPGEQYTTHWYITHWYIHWYITPFLAPPLSTQGTSQSPPPSRSPPPPPPLLLSHPTPTHLYPPLNPGECDIGYFLGTSLTEQDARKYECAIVRLYHNKLIESGGHQVSQRPQEHVGNSPRSTAYALTGFCTHVNVTLHTVSGSKFPSAR